MAGSKEQRTAIFLDGGNLYFKLRSLSIPNLLKFGYGPFAEWLAHGRPLISRRYYVGVVRAQNDDARGQELRQYQRKLFNHLQSPQQGFEIRKGYLMKNDGTYHEKGVDVEIAVDLLVDAYEDRYDTAILVSSDTDLLPAVRKVKEIGKIVEYVGFAHQPSFGMTAQASLSRLLIKEDMEGFVFRG